MSNFPSSVICETSTVQDGNMDFRFGAKTVSSSIVHALGHAFVAVHTDDPTLKSSNLVDGV